MEIPGGQDIGCESCAFRQASETRGEVYNVMKATLCELGGVPFYCHYTKDGRNFHLSAEKPVIQELRICEGWKAAVRDKEWNQDREHQKLVAELALGALEKLTVEGTDSQQHLATIRRAIEILTGEQIT